MLLILCELLEICGNEMHGFNPVIFTDISSISRETFVRSVSPIPELLQVRSDLKVCSNGGQTKPNKPNDVKASPTNELGENPEEQSQSTYLPYYLLLAMISAPFFRKNGWNYIPDSKLGARCVADGC